MLAFNPDDLTLGEMCDVEEASGFNITALNVDENGNAALPAKALVAIAWVLKRREQPDFTLEQARNIKIEELMGPEENPTNGNS